MSFIFFKERDKHQLCRQMVFELVQALKFKINIPDGNLLLLVGFVLQDAGGTLPPGIVAGKFRLQFIEMNTKRRAHFSLHRPARNATSLHNQRC